MNPDGLRTMGIMFRARPGGAKPDWLVVCCGMSILYISHDLLSVAALSHRVAILHDGEIVEAGPTSRIFAAPVHSYTAKLIASLPRRPLGIAEAPETDWVATLINSV